MEITTVGRRIRILREARGMSQRELIEASGAKSVSMIEAGYRRDPQYSTLVRVATALGVAVSDLFIEFPGGE